MTDLPVSQPRSPDDADVAWGRQEAHRLGLDTNDPVRLRVMLHSALVEIERLRGATPPETSAAELRQAPALTEDDVLDIIANCEGDSGLVAKRIVAALAPEAQPAPMGAWRKSFADRLRALHGQIVHSVRMYHGQPKGPGLEHTIEVAASHLLDLARDMDAADVRPTPPTPEAASPPDVAGQLTAREAMLVEALTALSNKVFGFDLGDEPDVYSDYDQLIALQSQIRAALATLPRAASGDVGQDGWRPIETAPRDGTEFIARCGAEFAPFSCRWHEGTFIHVDPYDGLIAYKPSEWTPFPARDAPADRGE